VVLLALGATGLAVADKALVEAGKFTQIYDPKAKEKDLGASTGCEAKLYNAVLRANGRKLTNVCLTD